MAPEKTQDERIEDAAMALRQATMGVAPDRWMHTRTSTRERYRAQAAAVLEAADRPKPPPYPTDEMVKAYRSACKLAVREPGNEYFESTRSNLAAALAVDPVHQAALEYVRSQKYYEANSASSVRRSLSRAGVDLIAVVNEAGL